MNRTKISFFRTFLVLLVIIALNLYIFMSLTSGKEDQIGLAVFVLVINIILDACIITLVEMAIYNRGVKKPLQRIIEGIGRFMEGRFTEKIEYLHEKDVTEFDQIITGLNVMANELSYIEKIRTEFLSNVSHEMKTPLAIVQNYSVLLQSPDLTEEKRKEYTKGIMDQTKKMDRMFSNILKLSKLENQHFVPNLENYNLGEQLCECMLVYEDIWEKKELNIEADIEENVMVCLDRDLVSQVWLNLISNAVKFTRRGDKISLTLKSDGDKAIVVVSDTGCGMDKEVMKNIFHKFYQGDISHGMPGNGLGLPLVKSIVNACKGTVIVDSAPGVGSTFIVTLNKIKETTA